MGLFDGGIPAGVQNMLAQIVKSAAPELGQHIDNFAGLVKGFKDQLDRIEAQQRANHAEILAVLTGENHDRRTINGGSIDTGQSAASIAERDGSA